MITKNVSINLLFYGITIIIAAAVKLFYSSSNVSELIFVLKPVVKVVELFLGIPFYFDPDLGFRNASYGIIIGKSCAGLNFFIIVFCMFTFSFIGKLRKTKYKWVAFILFFLTSYIITMIVNAFRIIAAISFMGFNGMDLIDMHRMLGVVFYLFFLIVCYYAGRKIIPGVGIRNETAS